MCGHQEPHPPSRNRHPVFYVLCMISLFPMPPSSMSRKPQPPPPHTCTKTYTTNPVHILRWRGGKCRSDGSPSWARDMSENYTWPGPVSWACVRPDMDIIVPMYIPYNRADLIPPFKGPRPVSALLRFDVKFGDGKNLMVIHGHRLRHELLQLWSNRGLADSAVGPKSVKETEHDMAHSIFCVCPPGNTQVTAQRNHSCKSAHALWSSNILTHKHVRVDTHPFPLANTHPCMCKFSAHACSFQILAQTFRK